MSADIEREAFEAHIRRLNPSQVFVNKRDDGSYMNISVNGMWEGWQARAAIPPSTGVAAAALQFLADQAQELGMGYEVTLSDGEVIQTGVDDAKTARASASPYKITNTEDKDQ